MSTKVKERLKKLMLQLEHEDRVIFDRLIEENTGKTCDEGIELLSDDKVRLLATRIKNRKKKKKEVLVEA